MKETTDMVKAALDETERAQSAAMDAIELAKNNTKGTMDLLESVSVTAAGDPNDASLMSRSQIHFMIWNALI